MRRLAALLPLIALLGGASAAQAATQSVANPAPGVSRLTLSDSEEPGNLVVRAASPLGSATFAALLFDVDGDGASDRAVVVRRSGAGGTIAVRTTPDSTPECQQLAGGSARAIPGVTTSFLPGGAGWVVKIPIGYLAGGFAWHLTTGAPSPLEFCGGTDGLVDGIDRPIAVPELFPGGALPTCRTPRGMRRLASVGRVRTYRRTGRGPTLDRARRRVTIGAACNGERLISRLTATFTVPRRVKQGGRTRVRAVTVGRVSLQLRRGQTRALGVRLNATGRRLLARRSSFVLTARMTVRQRGRPVKTRSGVRIRVRRARTVRRSVIAARAAARLPAPPGVAVRRLGDRLVAVRWSPVPGAVGYRLSRDGRTVGQTAGMSLRARVRPGVRHRFRVVAVAPSGATGRASGLVRFRVPVRAPQRPGSLAAPVITSTGVRLSWAAARAGTFPVRGYRVLRDGVVVGQVTRRRLDVRRLAPGRAYRFAVTAVDSRGGLGPARQLTIHTELPPPSTGHLHAYLLASTDASFEDLQLHYDEVGVVYPTYFNCATADATQIVGRDDPLITQWARERRILVLPRFNCQNPRVLGALLDSPERRGQLVRRLAALAGAHGYDGLNLDFEAGPPRQREELTAFVAELAAALHRDGLRLSVAVSPKTRDSRTHPRSAFFDYRLLANYADWVWIMGWGLHWSTSAPGPIAPLDWLDRIAAYAAGLPHPERFVLGAPLYGMDWPADAGIGNPGRPLTHAQVLALAAQHGATPRLDAASGELTFTYRDGAGAEREVWFADAAAVGRRFALAARHGLGGIGVWRLGQEDQALWGDGLIGGAW